MSERFEKTLIDKYFNSESEWLSLKPSIEQYFHRGKASGGFFLQLLKFGSAWAKEISKPPVLLPLRELAEDREMCEEIARLLGGEFIRAEYDSSGNNGNVDIRFKENLNCFKKVISFYEDGYVSFPDACVDNAFQVFARISSKYKIETV